MFEIIFLNVCYYRGKLTFYTQPPAHEKPIETKIITEFSKGFDIESLLKEENEIIESMDDTKLIVDGVEMTSNEPVRVNFEELEQADQTEEASDDDDDDESLEEEEEMHLILGIFFKLCAIYLNSIN